MSLHMKVIECVFALLKLKVHATSEIGPLLMAKSFVSFENISNNSNEKLLVLTKKNI